LTINVSIDVLHGKSVFCITRKSRQVAGILLHISHALTKLFSLGNMLFAIS